MVKCPTCKLEHPIIAGAPNDCVSALSAALAEVIGAKKAAPEKPRSLGIAVGRVIHYVPRREEIEESRRPAEDQPLPHVAGVITAVWDPGRGYINATIFPDGSNTGLTDGGTAAPLPLACWRTSISLDPAGAPGTWHFPEQV